MQVAQFAAEQDIAGLTNRLMLACHHHLPQPGPATDAAFLLLHLLQQLVASVPSHMVLELAMPVSRQVAMIVAKASSTATEADQASLQQQAAAGASLDGKAASQALLLQCVSTANALMLRMLALQLDQSLLEPLLSSAGLWSWVCDIISAAELNTDALAAGSTQHAAVGVQLGSPDQQDMPGVIILAGTSVRQAAHGAMGLAHLWLALQASAAASARQPVSRAGASASDAQLRIILQSSTMIASSTSGTSQALAFKCACSCIQALSSSRHSQEQHGQPQNDVDMPDDDALSDQNPAAQQLSSTSRLFGGLQQYSKPQATSGWHSKQYGKQQGKQLGKQQQPQQLQLQQQQVSELGAADAGSSSLSGASDNEIADILLCVAQQSACSTSNAIIREAALSCLAAMLTSSTEPASSPDAMQDTSQQGTSAAAQAPAAGARQLLQVVQRAAAESDWNCVLLEEVLTRIQSAYLAPGSLLPPLYISGMQQQGTADTAEAAMQQELLYQSYGVNPGSAGSNEACSAAIAAAPLPDVSADQAAAAIPAAADLLFAAALLQGASSAQQEDIRSQLAASLDQGQLLAVLSKAVVMADDVALHTLLRVLLQQGLLGMHAGRLVESMQGILLEAGQQQQEQGECFKAGLRGRSLLQQGQMMPGAAAAHRMSRLPAVQAALTLRLLEQVDQLCVGLLPAVVQHGLVSSSGLVDLAGARDPQAVMQVLLEQGGAS